MLQDIIAWACIAAVVIVIAVFMFWYLKK